MMVIRTHHMTTLFFPANKALSNPKGFLLAFYQGSVTEGLGKYFVISLSDGLCEMEHSARKDALLT